MCYFSNFSDNINILGESFIILLAPIPTIRGLQRSERKTKLRQSGEKMIHEVPRFLKSTPGRYFR